MYRDAGIKPEKNQLNTKPGEGSMIRYGNSIKTRWHSPEFLSEEMKPDMPGEEEAGHYQTDNYCMCWKD